MEKEIMQSSQGVVLSHQQRQGGAASAKDHAVVAHFAGYRERPGPDTLVLTPYGIMPRKEADEWDHQP